MQEYYFAVVTDDDKGVPFGPVNKENMDVSRLIVDLTCWLDANETVTVVDNLTTRASPPQTTPSWQADYPLGDTSVLVATDTYPLSFLRTAVIHEGKAVVLDMGGGTPGLTYAVSFTATAGVSLRRRLVDILLTIDYPLNPDMVASAMDSLPITPDFPLIVTAGTILPYGFTGRVYVQNGIGGPITIVLPPNPVLGQSVSFADIGENADIYPVTFVGDASSPYVGSPAGTSYVANQRGFDLTFEWTGTFWHLDEDAGKYLPLTGGTLTGELSAPQYKINGVLFAFSGSNYHVILDASGGSGTDAALLLGGAATGYQNIYRATTHSIQSNDGLTIFATFDAAGLDVPVAVDTPQYRLSGGAFAAKSGDANVIYDAGGEIALALYGPGSGNVNYYRADQHIFQNNAGTQIWTLNSSGTITATTIAATTVAATTITASGALTGGTVNSNGSISAAGNIHAVGTVDGQQLTSSGHVTAAGNVSAVNLNASSTVNANTVAAAGTVSGNLITGNSINSNNSVNATIYQLRGLSFASMDALAIVTQLSDPGNAPNISMYTSGTNYYQNTLHQFTSRNVGGGETTYVQFNAGGTFNVTGSWSVISDDSLKQNVQPYSTGLAAVLALNPVSFEYTSNTPLRMAGEINYGLMASEVQPVLPEMVREVDLNLDGAPDPIQTLSPTHLVYVLLNAVKELEARVRQLEPPVS